MAFWETMKRGSDSAVKTHGETVVVGARELSGAVDPVEVEQSVSAGGARLMVGMVILFSLEDGEGIEDGEDAEARGFKGKVLSKTHEGAVWRVMVGPENRWDDDRF